MDRLLTKIRDLEKETINLSKEQQHQDALKVSAPEEIFSFVQWIQSSRIKAGGWTAGPLVVLSLFDGIGGVWSALSLLGIPFTGYSCEVNKDANQVVKARFPTVHHVGDVKALQKSSIPEKVDLIVGGFPCQDLSSMGYRKGFLAENVASMAWQDRDEISKHLKTIPIEIDSQELTPSRRRRIYWSNIPYPKKLPRLRDHESTSLQSVLKNGTALDSKIGCILSKNTAKSGFGSLDLVMDNATCELRYITVTEVEKALGYPAGYTNIKFHSSDKNGFLTANYMEEFEDVLQVTRVAGGRNLRTKTIVRTSLQTKPVRSRPLTERDNQSLRWSLLGNTFSVNVIAYLLSPLLERAGRAVLRPIVLPKCIKEQECSAMDPGEVWALYNSHERPNWYALIVSRTGDRFTQTPESKKKSPIHIEVRFLEMTDAYAAVEADEWDTIRGTGLFTVRATTDNQNSWVAFSHRMDNFLKFDELYFIYPSKDEVWAVYDSVARCRYLVYVIESYIDRNKAKQGKPGEESFHARCRLLQRVETEFYRLQDKEIDYTELSVFAFRAPYIFKSEGTLLKIELSARQRIGIRADFVNTPRKRQKMASNSDSEMEEEVDEEDVAIADVMGGGDTTRLQNYQDCS